MLHSIQNEKGMLLAPTMGILVILTSLALSYTALTQHNTRILLNDKQGEQAQYIMEAGIEDALHELAKNPGWRTGFQNKGFGNGSYTVSVEYVSPYFQIISTGNVNGSQNRATATVLTSLNTGSFKYAIQADNTINMNNSMGLVAGDAAASNVNISSSMTGAETDGSGDQVPAPDWASWEANATHVISGNHTFSSGTYSGIWYVNGSVTIDSNVTFSGTIAATGNINIGNAENIILLSGATNTVLVSGNNIQANNATQVYVEGLVYASNNIVMNNMSGTQFFGTLFAGNNVSSNSGSNLTITYDSDIGIHFPSYFNDPDGLGLEIVAWK